MHLSRYLKIYPCASEPGRVLLLATRRCAVLELSAAKWGQVHSGAELPEKERETLLRLGVLVPDREAEQREVLDTFNRINAESKHLAVLVTLTLECNLACPYCYEAPFRGRFRMSEATAELLMEKMRERMAEGVNLTVDFYGGEPLLALPLMKRIASGLKISAEELGVKFAFNIFTNGVLLTRPVVEELLPLGLAAVRVTIDGPRYIHDGQRPFVSGKGSFDIILENIRQVHGLVPIDLGGNYTRENYRRFTELLDELIRAGVEPGRFKAVAFSPITPKTDGSVVRDFGPTCILNDEPWMAEASIYLRGETIHRGFPVPRLKAGACMVEFENDLVVGYDGGIFKCPAFMGEESLRVGSLAEGITDYRDSHNLDVWKNEECLECAYLPLCFGGCRFLRKLKTGAIDGVDCRRAMLDATLETVVRQDLELAGR